MKKFSNLVMMALLTVCMGLTSCEDILGHWEKPTPVTPTAVSVTSITLSETTLNKKVGDAAVTLTATVAPADATDKSLTWSSDKETVATVADGVVTIVGTGTAIITATANDGSGVEATCTVSVGLLAGKFTINGNGNQVQFAQGNLQATTNDLGVTWTWGFAENQWDFIGDGGSETVGNEMVQAIDPYISGSGTVDLFGWVGASSSWTGVNQYGITWSDATSTSATDGYGDKDGDNGETLKSDWGNTIGTGWRTLTKDEWEWLLGPQTSPDPGTNCRMSSTIGGTLNARWVKAVVNSKNGLIIFPDEITWDATTMGTAPNTIHVPNDNYTYNTLTNDQWTALETAGCVFLPAAGYRSGSSVTKVDDEGNYWSSSPYSSNADYASSLYFSTNNDLNPADYYGRFFGFSVRLVLPAE